MPECKSCSPLPTRRQRSRQERGMTPGSHFLSGGCRRNLCRQSSSVSSLEKKRCDRRRPRERGLRCVAASTNQNAGFRCCDDGRRSAGVSHQASIKVFQRRFALKQIASPRAVRFPPFYAVAAPTQCPVRFSISPKPASCILYDHPPVVKR